jgi:hypothetical protein
LKLRKIMANSSLGNWVLLIRGVLKMGSEEGHQGDLSPNKTCMNVKGQSMGTRERLQVAEA